MKVSGDDVLLYRVYPKRTTWLMWSSMDYCEEKLISGGVHGNFCSYREKAGYVWKDSRILLKRMWAAIEMGKVKDVIDGYTLDFMTAYTLQDRVFELFEEDELKAHQILTRTMTNMRRISGYDKHLPGFNVGHFEHSADFVEKLVEDLNEAQLMSDPNTVEGQVYSYTEELSTSLFSHLDL